MGWLVAAFAAVVLAGALPAGARDGAASGHKVIAKGDKCVRDTEYMRRNHMNLLKHQRDETMHKGIRTVQYSLKNCIECHANPKTNSVASNKEDFCVACHSYTAVKLDCFECHSSKPKAAAVNSLPPVGVPATQSEDKAGDKQSSLSGKLRWQLQGKVASLNMGEGAK